MTSELAEFFATLLRIATFVVDVTLTLLCTILLLLASLLPWRLPFIVREKWATAHELTLREFQWQASRQFLLSLVDVVVFALVMPSFLWPLRWHGMVEVVQRAWTNHRCDDDDDRDHNHNYSGYKFDTRVEWLGHAFECYADVVLFPLVLIYCISPWRWTLHLDVLRKQHILRISFVRNWAAWEGFNAVIDMPFVLLGLASVVLPTRIQAFISVLIHRHHFRDLQRADCDARAYLAMLPLLSVVDLLSGLMALVALINPLRCGSFLRRSYAKWNLLEESFRMTPQLQEILRWNAPLRSIALRSGLASLLDLLLLPLGLVVCITVYRAGPLIATLRAAVGSDDVAPAWPMGTLEDLPISRVHQMVLKQSGLLLCDLLILPSFILVRLTCYRYPFIKLQRDELRNSWGVVAHHVAVFVNSLVLIHDLLLAICALPVLLTLYRLPKVYRLLQLRLVSPLAPLLPEAADPGTDAAEAIEAEVELARDGTKTRIRIWKEIGHLLLDLPLLPLLLILLLTLWRADLALEQCWRAENDWQRRTSVILEFVFLLRDILGFLALLVVLVTLLRMPKVLLDIYSQRARRVRTNLTPRFTLQRVTLRSGNPANHQNPGSDGRLVVEVQGVQENDRHLKDLGIIRINVISKSFWDEIGRVFGSSVASLGRALLPFTLKDGKHVKYSDFMPEEAKIDLRLGGRELKSKLLQLDGSIAMCVQLEHRPPQGEEEILAQLPIPAHLLQEAVNRPGEDIQVPEELMTAAPERVCGELLSGAGIRNAMWLCALSELWQLVLDVVHLLLFFFLAVAPWRLLQCIYFAGQPSEVWHGTLAKLLSSLLLAKEAMLQLFRRRLEPLLNAAAKDPPQRTSDKLGEVASQLLRQLPMVSASSERALLSELERCQSDVAVNFVQKVKAYSLLQNAVSSYWPGLTLGANLQLTHQCFNPQEHALVIEQISGAQSRADELLFSLAAEVQAASREFKAFSSSGAGFLGNACQKPLSEHRRMVQIFAYEVLKDYGTLLLGLLLVLSVYRLPSVLRDLQRHQGDFVHRARMVLTCQVRLLLRDLWMFFTALLASLLALVTLVRALEFLRVAFLHCGSLEELRREALNATKDALDSLGELLLLLTFWDTYKTLVYAAIFAILLPAWGLILLPIPLRILIWLAFCILPFVTSQIACLAAYGLTVLLFFTTALVRKGSGMPSCSAAHLKTLRLTGMNALVLLSILLDAALLSSAFSVNEVEAVLKSTSCWYIASGITIAWLVVMSMPHAMSQDGCLKSGKFHVGLQLLRRCLLPAALVFIFHLDDHEKQRLACLWLAFLSFTAVLGLDLLSQDHLPDSIGLDLVQPPAFLSGLLFLQLLFATLKILIGQLLWLPCVAAALCFLWVLLFQSLGGVGGPLWIFPLQLTASVVVFWFALSKNFLLDGMLEGGLAVLLLLCIVAMITCECLALCRRKSAMEKAGVAKVLQQILEKLSKKGRLLNEAQLPNASNLSTSNLSTLSPIEVAKTLENFEEATRMECLTTGFLQQRKEWLSQLRIGRNDYDVVAECGHRLLEGVCVPPSTVQIFLLLKRKSGRRIPTAIWQMILEYVSDVRYVSKMFAPIVNHFGLGGPGKHLLRAWHIMETLGHRNKAVSAAMAFTDSQSLSHDTAQVGLVVTVSSSSESHEPPWRGRILTIGRRGVYVENLETSAQTMISWKSGRLQVEKQPLQERIQEDLQRWWRDAENLYGHRCGLKTTEARTRGLNSFSCCWCCRRRRHADAQEKTTKGGSVSVPRRLCSGCPAVEFPAADAQQRFSV